MEEAVNKAGLTLKQFLESYDPNRYEHPSVTVDMAVFTMLEREDGLALAVLLIRRGDHPNIGKYALPGGFVEMQEDTWDAAARELYEETGVKGLCMRQCGTFGAVDRDPRTRVITVAHYALAPLGSIEPKAGDDAADAGLFEVETEFLAGCASAETYGISLYGRETLSCKAQLRYDPLGARACPIAGGDLAGDHGHVLFSALCALNSQPRRRMARLFTAGNPDREQEAMQALDAALRALPVLP